MMTMTADGNHPPTLFTLVTAQATDGNTQAKNSQIKPRCSPHFLILMVSSIRSTIETTVANQESWQNDDN